MPSKGVLYQKKSNFPSYIPQAFTLNSVPPVEDEIVQSGIGRNFVSRDLLEATSTADALDVKPSNVCLYLMKFKISLII